MKKLASPAPVATPPAASPAPVSAVDKLRGGLPERVRDGIRRHQARLGKYDVLLTEFDKLPIGERYRALQKALCLDEKRADPAALEEAVDRAARHCAEAGQLYAAAKSEVDSFKLTLEAASYHWELEARRKLADLKERGDIGGQITEKLIERWMLSNIDEYAQLRRDLEDLEKYRNSLEAFYKSWERKATAITVQAKMVYARRGVNIDQLFSDRLEKETHVD